MDMWEQNRHGMAWNETDKKGISRELTTRDAEKQGFVGKEQTRKSVVRDSKGKEWQTQESELHG